MKELSIELKVLDDERIRNGLIKLLNCIAAIEYEDNFGITKEEALEWVKRQGEQKPIDKVEPKFHEGEWIISDTVDKDYHICKITSIKDGNYTIESTYGYKGYNQFDVFDNTYRLWTIRDAKDGDVLTCYSDIKGQPIEQTGIIKQYVGRHGGCSNSFEAYIGVDWDGNIITDGYMGSTNISPATKEQRGLLFQKMKEAGYEWDAELKQLKKIEQKSVVWSEEDKEMLDGIIVDVKVLKEQDRTKDGKAAYQKEIDWLKSLKDRVRPQPKQEWSVKDLTRFNDVIRIIEGSDNFASIKKHYVDFLKSIMQRSIPQNRWKPSDGQLECLGYAIEKAEKDWSPLTNNRIYLTLKALKEQLKKLRDE